VRSLLLLGIGQSAPLLADLGGDLLDGEAGVGFLDNVAALSLEDKVRAERALGLVARGFFCNTFGLRKRGVSDCSRGSRGKKESFGTHHGKDFRCNASGRLNL
jgi:hypothetical protein